MCTTISVWTPIWSLSNFVNFAWNAGENRSVSFAFPLNTVRIRVATGKISTNFCIYKEEQIKKSSVFIQSIEKIDHHTTLQNVIRNKFKKTRINRLKQENSVYGAMQPLRIESSEQQQYWWQWSKYALQAFEITNRFSTAVAAHRMQWKLHGRDKLYFRKTAWSWNSSIIQNSGRSYIAISINSL